MIDEQASRHICENGLKRFVNMFLCCSLLLAFIFCTVGCAELEDTDLSNQCLSLFDSPSALHLELTTDMSLLLDKNHGEEYISAKGLFRMGRDTIQHNKFKIKRRGVTRQKICDIPPIMLRFGKKGERVKLKLVIPCKNDTSYQELVYKEHLAYQLYGSITDKSFRTRQVDVVLHDDSGTYPSIELRGFVIEDDKCLADRLGGSLAEKGVNMKYIDQEAYRLFTLFQYMIGNTDWNLNMRHNIKMITIGESTPIPIPYDFDFSGLVDAPYALPHHNMPIKNVRERYFMWRGKDKTGFQPTIDLYLERKNHILSAVAADPDLSIEDKESMQNYLNEFYEELEAGELVSS